MGSQEPFHPKHIHNPNPQHLGKASPKLHYDQAGHPCHVVFNYLLINPIYVYVAACFLLLIR